MIARPAERVSALLAALGERLSEVSSCIGKLDARIACFGIEDDEQLASEGDADDHFLLAGSLQSLMEGSEMRVVSGNESGNHKEDRTRPGATAAH